MLRCQQDGHTNQMPNVELQNKEQTSANNLSRTQSLQSYLECHICLDLFSSVAELYAHTLTVHHTALTQPKRAVHGSVPRNNDPLKTSQTSTSTYVLNDNHTPRSCVCHTLSDKWCCW